MQAAFVIEMLRLVWFVRFAGVEASLKLSSLLPGIMLAGAMDIVGVVAGELRCGDLK